MQESKPVKVGDNKLESIRIGEQYIHPWIVNVKHEELEEGIGTCYKVISPESVDFVGVLLDYDLEDHPRFIFAYFNKKANREFIIDTKHQIGWSINFQNKCWEL